MIFPNIIKQSDMNEENKYIDDRISYLKKEIDRNYLTIQRIKKRKEAIKYLVDMDILTATQIPAIHITNHLIIHKSCETLIRNPEIIETKHINLRFYAREGDLLEIHPKDGTNKLKFFTIKNGKLYTILPKEKDGKFTLWDHEFVEEDKLEDHMKLEEYKEAKLIKQ